MKPLLRLSLDHGMDQSSDARLAPADSFGLVQNCRTKGKGMLRKRGGTRGLAGNCSSTPNPRITSTATGWVESPMLLTQVRGAGVLAMTNGNAFALDASSSDEFDFVGRVSTCKPVRKRYGIVIADAAASAGGFGKTCPAIAALSTGHVLVAALDGSGSPYAYIENAAGVRIWTLVDTGATYARIKAVSQGTTFVLIAQALAGTQLTARVLTPTSSTVTVGAETNLVSLTHASSYWDTASYDANNWALCYHSDLAAGTYTVARVNGVTVGTTQTFTLTAAVDSPVAVSALVSRGQIWIGYYDDPAGGGHARYKVYTFATLALVTTGTLANGADQWGPGLFGATHTLTNPTDATNAYSCVLNYVASGNHNVCGYTGSADTSGSITTAIVMQNFFPLSKFDSYGRIWGLITNRSGNQLLSRVVLIRLPGGIDGLDMPPVIELATPLFENFGPTYDPAVLDRYGYFHEIAQADDACYFAFPVVLASANNATGAVPTIQIAVYQYTRSDQDTHVEAELLGASTAIAGQPVEVWGQPSGQVTTVSQSDGKYIGCAEMGFAHAPVITSTSQSPGTSPGAGVYAYRAIYEWVDLYGRLHRSAPSAAVEVTVTAGNTVSVVMTALALTQRQSGGGLYTTQLVLYRTLAGGTTYHRLPGTVSSYVNSSTTGRTYTDTHADSVIAANPILYTDGGVAENDLAPSCRFMARAESRLWCGGLWDPQIIQCSKLFVPGEAVAFTSHEAFAVVVPDDVTGLAYMDGQVIAFAATAIYLVSGDGPDDTGNGQFTAPRAYTHDVGCVNYRSILETNIGVLFQAAQGFYLIPRGFGPVVYVGAAIRTELLSYPDCLAAAVYNGNGDHIARFLMAASGDATSTIAFCFDLDSGHWFEDTFGHAQRELGVWPDGFVLASSDFVSTSNATPIWYDDTSYVGDASDTLFIATLVRTNWIYPAGIGGWCVVSSVSVGLEVTGATQDLALQIQIDEQAAQSTTFTLTNASATAFRGVLPAVGTQQGCALQVTLTESAHAGTITAGLGYISLVIEAEDTEKPRLLSSAERG